MTKTENYSLKKANLWKVVTTMKIMFCLLTLCLGNVFASSAYSQMTHLTVQAENSSLKEVISQIESQSEFVFFYSDNIIDPNLKIDITSNGETLGQILDKLSVSTNYQYAILDKQVFISQKEETDTTQSTYSTPLKTVTGIVKDEFGEPIIGAAITVKGATIGTTTDMDGRFVLDVEPQSVLVISYLGYQTQEIIVRDRLNLNIILKEDEKSLDEVVIVGYGFQKKINLTGAVETVKSERISNKPVTSLATALTGEAAGVTVTQNSGQPGANQGTVRIRGIGTWEDASPLVLVDGIAMSMNSVIPSEVESVTVLKDAASAAIYGSRAANGVILITTKQGKKGKNTFSYDGNFGIQNATRIPKMANSWQYAELYNQMMTNEGKADENGYSSLFPADRIERMKKGGDPDKLEGNTDWYKEVLRSNAFQQIHQVSFNGGGEKTAYMGSLGYSKQEGIIPTTSYERYNARINTTTDLTNWFKLGLNLAYLTGTQRETSTGADNVFSRIGKSLPYVPVKFSDGTYSYISAPTNSVRRASSDYGMKKDRSSTTLIQISPEFNFFKDLFIKGTFGYESTVNTNKKFDKTVKYDAFEPAGQSAITEISRNKQTDKWEEYRNLTANLTATYGYQLGQNNFKIMGGGSVETSKYAFTEASRQDFPNNDFSEINAGDPSTAVANGNSIYSSLASLFGRFNYDYAGRYLFEANLRYDGSSQFARGNRWGTFPSFSGAWRISEEHFFDGLKEHIQNLKLRGSWGKLGNQKIRDNYQFISSIGSGGTYMFDNKLQTGYKETVMGNPFITWETSTSTNIGVDIALMDNRLNLAFDWYKRKTEDILLKLPSPEILGIRAPFQNAGSVENKGWEITVGWRDVIGKDFHYFVNANLSDVKNKIVDLRGYKSPTDILHTRIEGVPLDALFGWKTLGICETQAQYDQYHEVMKTYNPNWGIGDIIIADLHKDGKIDAEDKTVIGNSIPRYTFGINLGFDYKGFDFSCFFQGVGKADGYIAEGLQRAMGINSARKEHYKKTFNPADPKPGMYYPRVLQNSIYNFGYMSHWVQNASYIRLKNLQLGYTFNIPHVNKLRVYFSGENLLTITKFKSWDPETPVGTTGNLYPNVAVFSLGINLNL